jgi:hypothetical protein
MRCPASASGAAGLPCRSRYARLAYSATPTPNRRRLYRLLTEGVGDDGAPGAGSLAEPACVTALQSAASAGVGAMRCSWPAPCVYSEEMTMAIQVKHWQDPVNLILGLALLASPWVLGYQGEQSATWNASCSVC